MEIGVNEIMRHPSPRLGELQRMSAASMETEEAIIEYMKCPRCRQYIQPPCQSCDRGHFMCTPCKAVVESCPTCGSTSFPNRVNAVFDRILREMHYPCVNEENGCLAFFKYAEIAEHQQHCSYVKVACRFKEDGCNVECTAREKSYHEESCPYGVSCKLFLKANGNVKYDCQWRGSKNELYDHVRSHPETAWLPPSSLQTNVIFTWMLAMNMDFQKTEFIRLDDVGEMFYFHVKSHPEKSQSIAVQHIGSDEVGSSFMYAVEFKYGSKLIVFRDTVVPFSEPNVFKHSACCIFHFKFLRHHFQAERVCDCYIRIFLKGQENKKGKRILHFLGTAISEERDGSVSNRESFQDKIENCLEAMSFSNDDIDSSHC